MLAGVKISHCGGRKGYSSASENRDVEGRLPMTE